MRYLYVYILQWGWKVVYKIDAFLGDGQNVGTLMLCLDDVPQRSVLVDETETIN